MAKFNLGLPTLLIIGALVWLFAFGGLATVQTWFAVTPAAPSGGQPVDGIICPDTLNTAYDGDVVNGMDTSQTTYLAQIGRFIPDGAFNSYVAFTSAVTAGGGTAINLRCGRSYVYYLLPAQDGFINPLEPINFGVVEGSDASRVVSAKNLSLLTMNAYDNIARALVWETEEQVAAGTYDDLAAHFDSTTNNTAIALGVGDTLDWDFNVKTIESVATFGNSNIGLYIGVDADKTDYDTPLLQLNGVTLTDVKNTGEISSEDLATLSSYEYIFKVPAGVEFTSAPMTLRFFVAGKSGQNADADIVLRFLAKSHYVANDGFSIYTDIFNKASGTEILTGTAQTATIDVS